MSYIPLFNITRRAVMRLDLGYDHTDRMKHTFSGVLASA